MNVSYNNVSYKIDSQDRLVWVNEGWDEFAAANDGQSMLSSKVVGKSLWRYISDNSICYLYGIMVERVRTKDLELTFRIRCDSPDKQRLIDLTARPDGQDVRFDCVIVSEESRPHAAILDAGVPRSGEKIRMCSWCHRISVKRTWVELLRAIEQLGLMGMPTLPEVTHGICPDCYNAAMETLKPRL